MILCLDCGNTRLKWGCYEEGNWVASGALAYDELARLEEVLPNTNELQYAIGCNVAGQAQARLIEVALPGPVDWIASTATQCGVISGYEIPAQLGTDRWAALIGARMLQTGPVVVVMAGTATTIDALGDDGQHRGGLILPGMSLMASSLASGTAALPLAQGKFEAFPRNTHDAIVSGAIQATVGAINRISQLLSGEASCILSGGAATQLQPHLGSRTRYVERLVLEGLASIALQTIKMRSHRG